MAGKRGLAWYRINEEYDRYSCSQRITQIEQRIESLKKTKTNAENYRVKHGLPEEPSNIDRVISMEEQYLNDLHVLND